MSRRIIFFALAASATLIATQASADRECFEDSCGYFEVAEPATSSLPYKPAPNASRAKRSVGPISSSASSRSLAWAVMRTRVCPPLARKATADTRRGHGFDLIIRLSTSSGDRISRRRDDSDPKDPGSPLQGSRRRLPPSTGWSAVWRLDRCRAQRKRHRIC